jgi:hypothetical protein
MPRKKVTFGAQPKAQAPNINEWVESREVVSSPEDASPEPAAQPEPTTTTHQASRLGDSPPPPEKIKRLTLDIPESLHRRIKGKAVMEGTTMVEMLRELLLETYQ